MPGHAPGMRLPLREGWFEPVVSLALPFLRLAETWVACPLRGALGGTGTSFLLLEGLGVVNAPKKGPIGPPGALVLKKSLPGGDEPGRGTLKLNDGTLVVAGAAEERLPVLTPLVVAAVVAEPGKRRRLKSLLRAASPLCVALALPVVLLLLSPSLRSRASKRDANEVLRSVI